MVFSFFVVLIAPLHKIPKLNTAGILLLYFYVNYADSFLYAAIDLMVEWRHPKPTALQCK
jgi:hypothetical protein